jgi:hypothetical protein
VSALAAAQGFDLRSQAAWPSTADRPRLRVDSQHVCAHKRPAPGTARGALLALYVAWRGATQASRPPSP